MPLLEPLRQPVTRSILLISPSPSRLALHLAPAVGAVLALASLAWGVSGGAPVAAAEGAYLACAAGIVLIAAAAVAPGVAVPAIGATAVVALAWIVPAGPARGALVETAAAATLALAAAGRVGNRSWGRDGATDRRGLEALLQPVPAVGLALGLQALLRADELLGPPSAAWALVVYLALPAVGAGAVMALARLDTPRSAVLAAAAVLVVGPGFRPATVVALVALAAAPVALDPRRLARRWPWGGASTSLWIRLSAGGLLLAPAVWSPSAALVSALAGCAMALRGRPAATAGVIAAGVGLALAPALGSSAPPAVAWLGALVVPAAVPTVVLPARGRFGVAAAALALAAAAAVVVPVDGALAAPAALAAMAVCDGRRSGGHPPADRAAPGLQLAWSLLLLGGGALAGAYPWLRWEPLAACLEMIGLAGRGAADVWSGPVALVVIAPLLAGLSRSLSHGPGAWALPRSWTAGRTAALLTLLATGIGLVAAMPRPLAVPIGGGTPLNLSSPRTAWSTQLDPETEGAAVGAVVIDSSLANAGGLAAGTPVATVVLRGVDAPEIHWILRVGRETSEWAADRGAGPSAGGAAAADPARPAPWISWVPAGPESADRQAERPFYGHAYRAVLSPATASGGGSRAGPGHERGPLRADRLELRLRPDLPPEVILTVFRLELRP